MHEQSEMVESLRSEWLTWFSMISRCHFEGDPAYANYGGRGIRVCERWRTLDGFKNFLADMGRRPEGLSLDRKNNDEGYTPSNCHWTTRQQQCRNRRSTKFLTIDGVTAPMAEWAEKSGVSLSVVSARIRAGQDAKSAVFTPLRADTPLPIGAHFSAWEVIGIVRHQGARFYECRCACGGVRKIRHLDLIKGRTRSCRSCRMKGNTYASGVRGIRSKK